MRKIRKGDQVVILAGKDKGREGVVLRVIQCCSDLKKVVVEGVNLVKKTVKSNLSQNKPGEIVSMEAAIHISNVAIFNAITGDPDRVGFKMLDNKRKVRVFKSNGEVIDV